MENYTLGYFEHFEQIYFVCSYWFFFKMALTFLFWKVFGNLKFSKKLLTIKNPFFSNIYFWERFKLICIHFWKPAYFHFFNLWQITVYFINVDLAFFKFLKTIKQPSFITKLFLGCRIFSLTLSLKKYFENSTRIIYFCGYWIFWKNFISLLMFYCLLSISLLHTKTYFHVVFVNYI